MQTVGDIVDSISRRVRDASNTAHTRAFVRDLIDRVQVVVNAKQAYVYQDTTLVTTPGQALYRLETALAGTIDVTDVHTSGDRHIPRIDPWKNLWKLSPTWLTDTGSPRGWAQIGRTLFAIWPTPATAETLTVSGTKVTNAIVSDLDILEFRDEYADIIKDLVTALLLFRQRDIDMIGEVVKRMQMRLGILGE